MSCPDCFTGTVRHDERPQGQEVTLHGRKTYVSEPKGEVKGIIIIIPDAFGIEFINNQVLADHYASKSDYKVYLPDFSEGHSAPTWLMQTMGQFMTASKTYGEMLWKPYYLAQTLSGFIPFTYYNRYGVYMPRVKSFFTAVRENEGAHIPIAAAGFCWGGLHTFHLCHGLTAPNGKPLVDAGFTAHPSNISIPGDIEKVTKPISVANGDRDMVLSLKGLKDIERILNGKQDVDTEVVLYDGAGHGFAVRGDWDNEKQSQQALDAEDQAINFFKRAFAKVSY